ncbi:MAG: condensation domain-containing protein, partial [Bacillota bacterium]
MKNSADVIVPKGSNDPKDNAKMIEKQMADGELYANLPDERNLHTSPLTDNQMGIYLECISRPNSLAYNIPFFFEFEKNICADAEALKKMVDECLMPHKALFTKIVQTEQGVVMTLGEVAPVCEIHKGKDEEIPQICEKFIRPYDLSVAPLCRAIIIETDTKFRLFIDIHHIVFDGASLILFEEELGNQLQGKAIEPETISPFHLYELEQREKASEQYQEDKAYFDGILSGLEVNSELLPDHKIDGEVEFFPAQNYEIKLDGDLGDEKLTSFVKQTGVSESSLFMSAFGYALAKFTGQEESIFSVATRGRKHPKLSRCVSMMVKSLPVYMKLLESQSATDFIKTTQDEFYETIRHNKMTFVDIVEEYAVIPAVKFVYQGSGFNEIQYANGSSAITLVKNSHTIGSLNCMVTKKDGGYSVVMTYRSDLYDESTITRFTKLYERVLKAFSQDAKLQDIEMIEETDSVIYEAGNDTNIDFDESQT